MIVRMNVFVLLLVILIEKDAFVQAFNNIFRPSIISRGIQSSISRNRNVELQVSPRKFDVGENNQQDFGQDLVKHNLLTFDDEVELSRQYKVCLFIKNKEKEIQELKNTEDSIPLGEIAVSLQISDEKLKHLVWKGEMAKKVLVRANMRLVFHIARHYLKRGIAYPDLVQEGTFGLIKAVDKYDGEKGYRFSTYASWWIKQSISRAVAEKSRIIRLPVHIHDMMMTVLKVEKSYMLDFNRRPTYKELSEKLGLPVHKVQLLLKMAKDVSSTDMSTFHNNDGSPGMQTKDKISSESTEPCDVNESLYVHNELKKVMVDLTDKENDVLAMRFGLSSGTPMTLEEVGKQYNVTRERVRQIESRAMKKIVSSPMALKIKAMFADEDLEFNDYTSSVSVRDPILARQ